MKPATRATALAASLLLIPGCGMLQKDASSSSSTTASAAYEQLARPVGIVDGTTGDDASLPGPGVFLINDPADVDNYADSPIATLGVDFASQTIVVLALGPQPTGGYWASIDALQIEGEDLVVQGTVNRPGENQMVSQVASHPFAAVVVPKLENVTPLADINAVTGQPRPE